MHSVSGTGTHRTVAGARPDSRPLPSPPGSSAVVLNSMGSPLAALRQFDHQSIKSLAHTAHLVCNANVRACALKLTAGICPLIRIQSGTILKLILQVGCRIPTKSQGRAGCGNLYGQSRSHWRDSKHAVACG